MTAGCDIVNYPRKLATKTSYLPANKSIINSGISTKAILYMNMDINHYYLWTPLGRYEFFKIAFSMVPNRIMEE
jgi:hypothetical protein